LKQIFRQIKGREEEGKKGRNSFYYKKKDKRDDQSLSVCQASKMYSTAQAMKNINKFKQVTIYISTGQC